MIQLWILSRETGGGHGLVIQSWILSRDTGVDRVWCYSCLYAQIIQEWIWPGGGRDGYGREKSGKDTV